MLSCRGNAVYTQFWSIIVSKWKKLNTDSAYCCSSSSWDEIYICLYYIIYHFSIFAVSIYNFQNTLLNYLTLFYCYTHWIRKKPSMQWCVISSNWIFLRLNVYQCEEGNAILMSVLIGDAHIYYNHASPINLRDTSNHLSPTFVEHQNKKIII